MKEIKTFDSIKANSSLQPKRYAARAVIFKDNKLLMLYLSKTNEYKFPGGGVEENESFEDALNREALEEAGVQIKEIKSCLGYIDQIYPDKYDATQTYYMRSIYYLCDIHNEIIKQSLSTQEKMLGFKPVWVTIDQAIKINEMRISNGSDYHWTKRELYMLHYLHKIKEKL